MYTILRKRESDLMNKFKFIFSVEMIFVLFLSAGAFKMSLNLPFDFTVFTAVILLILILVKFIRNPSILKCSLLPMGCIAIFTVILIISILYSPSRIYGIDKAIHFFSTTLTAFIVPLLIFRSKKSLNYFIKSIYFVSIILSLISLNIILQGRQNDSGFIALGGDNYLGLARILGMGAVIAFTFMLLDYKIKSIMKHFIFLCVIVFSLLSTGGRMPFIAFLITSLFLLAFIINLSRGNIPIKGIKKIILIAPLLYLGTWVLLKYSTYTTSINRILVLFTEPDGGASAHQRTIYFKSAIQMFEGNPLFGRGIGSFGIYHLGIDSRLYPHNIFLEVLGEMGIIGATALSFLIVLSFYLGFKYIKSTEINTTTLCVFLITFYLFINSNVSGDLNDNRIFFAALSTLFMVRVSMTKTTTKQLDTRA